MKSQIIKLRGLSRIMLITVFAFLLISSAWAVEDDPITVKRLADGCTIEVRLQIAIESVVDENDDYEIPEGYHTPENYDRDMVNAALDSTNGCFPTHCFIYCPWPLEPPCDVFVYVDVKRWQDLTEAEKSKYYRVRILGETLRSSALTGTPNADIMDEYTDADWLGYENGAHGVWQRGANALVYCHEALHLSGLDDLYCEVEIVDGERVEDPSCPDPPGPVPCDCAIENNSGWKRCTGCDDDIMANTDDGQFTCDHILQIVEKAGLNNCPLYCCPFYAPYWFGIDHLDSVSLGSTQQVSITLETTDLLMGGFDFVIAYDAVALSLMGSDPGAVFYDPDPAGCGWEYFTYRFGEGDCGEPWCSGLVRLTGLADINNGPYHPSCYGPPDANPNELATMTFYVTEDLTFEGQFIPIKFFWDDCGDNSVSSVDGEVLYIDRAIFDFEGNLIWNEEDNLHYPEESRPLYVGTPDSCSFGGERFVCGDANGDGTINVGDAVFIINYVFKGGPAPDPVESGDANNDGDCNVGDAVYEINYVFKGGPAPVCDDGSERLLDFRHGGIQIQAEPK